VSTPLSTLASRLDSHQATIGVVGLGYVGLPLACLLSDKFKIIGFDIDAEKVESLKAFDDPAGEVDSYALESAVALGFEITTDLSKLSECPVVIVCVATPVDALNRPNLKPLLGAALTVGQNISAGTIVVFESTVYPGVTNGLCCDAILSAERLTRSQFSVGYSPERVNPGDKVNTTKTIVKLVAGSTPEETDLLAHVYGSVLQNGVYKCPSIEVAEATKLFENVQRDVNIAYVNQYAQLCDKVGISMMDVLDAAKTKWNALGYVPGMVGGDCIYTDPFYAIKLGEQLGMSLTMIQHAREVNTHVPLWLAHKVSDLLGEGRKRVGIFGLSFKEDVRDYRNSGALVVAHALQAEGHDVLCHDPVVDVAVTQTHGVALLGLDQIGDLDVLIIAAKHKVFQESKTVLLSKLAPGGILIDVKAMFSAEERAILQSTFQYWRF